MYVVITKLRATQTSSSSHGGGAHAASSGSSSDHDHMHQNWKAAKALLVIIPLLGITYLITITGPSASDNMAAYLVFIHVRAFLLSIQGFAVTLPYCFLNTEIRNVVRCHWERYQTTRSVAEHTQHTRLNMSQTRAGSNAGFLSAHRNNHHNQHHQQHHNNLNSANNSARNSLNVHYHLQQQQQHNSSSGNNQEKSLIGHRLSPSPSPSPTPTPNNGPTTGAQQAEQESVFVVSGNGGSKVAAAAANNDSHSNKLVVRLEKGESDESKPLVQQQAQASDEAHKETV